MLSLGRPEFNPQSGNHPTCCAGWPKCKKIKIKNLEKRILIEYFHHAISKLTVKFFILSLNTFKGYNLKYIVNVSVLT